MEKKKSTSAPNPEGERSGVGAATAAENAQWAKLLLADCQSLLAATKLYRKTIKSVLCSDAEFAPKLTLEEDLEAAIGKHGRTGQLSRASGQQFGRGPTARFGDC